MSVLIYPEAVEGQLKKTAFELASYAKALADQSGTTVTAVTLNAKNIDDLAAYGVTKVLDYQNDDLKGFNPKAAAEIIAGAVQKSDAKIVLISATTDGKYLAPLLAVKVGAGYVPNVTALPESTNPVVVKNSTFTNKAYSHTQVNQDIALLSLSKNAFGVKENPVTLSKEVFEITLSDQALQHKVLEVSKATNKVTIADADIVVSGGRGLKGPENWGMIEELAEVLGAATACSKPVSDIGWRPHSEHVGQTGKPVASNLYIAVGISGAIQHLAGVNASKVKVVINNDPEAPFFKAADYGVVGDAFEVVPQLTEKLKAFKAANG